MSTCAFCSKELKFSNKASFGNGKLLDGNELCVDCVMKFKTKYPSLALKKMTVDELKGYQERFTQLKETQIVQSEIRQKETSTKIEKIKAQISNQKLSNGSAFLGRKEILELPNILSDDETIDGLIQGTDNKGQGILVSTDRRLIFVDKGLLYGLKVEDFPNDRITSIQYDLGMILGKVKIHTSGNIATIENVEKNSARNFAEFVRTKLSKPKEIPTSNSPQISVVEQLEKLGKLKEIGVLTEEEFVEQKKKLLERI